MPEDIFTPMVEAFEDAKRQMIESARDVKASVVRPANPNSETVRRQDRLREFDTFMSDPALRESEFLRLKERYQVPDGQIPRRLVNYILMSQRDRKKAEYGRTSR